MKLVLFASAVVSILGLSSCGPKAFVKGQYDDVNRENLMNDQWSETDMQVIVKSMVDSLVAHPLIANAKNPPVVIITKLTNKTSEHIDTESIMDMVSTELTNSGKVSFVNKQAREDISNEYDYQNNGSTAEETKKGPGGQTGADFIIDGRLDSIVQEVGKDKSVYYKLTLNMTNLKKAVIVWSNQKQIRKTFKKKSVGL